MKRFLSAFLALCLFPVFCLADPGVVLSYRLNHYAAADNELFPGSFPYDSMFIDIYLMDDFKTLYYSKTLFVDGSIETTGLAACQIEKIDGKYNFVLPSGEKMSFYYDDEGSFWLDMSGGLFKLYPCERFSIKKDFVSK